MHMCKTRGKLAQGRSQSFYNLILEVIFQYLCHILFIRSELLGLVQAWGKGIHEGVTIRRYRLLGPF